MGTLQIFEGEIEKLSRKNTLHRGWIHCSLKTKIETKKMIVVILVRLNGQFLAALYISKPND